MNQKMALNIGTLSRVLFLGQAPRFAQPTFESIEKQLQNWAEPGVMRGFYWMISIAKRGMQW